MPAIMDVDPAKEGALAANGENQIPAPAESLAPQIQQMDADDAKTGQVETSKSERPPFEIPVGFQVHTETSTSILIPKSDSTSPKTVFLNPVQEYNRDLSVAAIRTWSEIFDKESLEKRERERAKRVQKDSQKRKKRKVELTIDAENVGAPTEEIEAVLPPLPPHKFTIFEALSASGLRSIRYAKEIPLLKWVLANDLSRSAVQSIRQNIRLNGMEPADEKGQMANGLGQGKVRVSEADCTDVMYSHRKEKLRFDVIDLDPYGTAAPFLDAAVQAVRDGGLLCVTCTDMAVLSGSNYPEKAFSNYGGASIRAEYTHEMALRLVLHAISTSAARYGRFIEPMVSLSIDFYVRVFVRVNTSPLKTKRAFAKTGLVYVCQNCQMFHVQPFGKGSGTNDANESFKPAGGPVSTQACHECGGPFKIGGPLWIDRLHDKEFLQHMLDHIKSEEAVYGTKARMTGMITVAKNELPDLFYFTPSRLAGNFRCTAPSIVNIGRRSALLNAGYDISRSHAVPGSIKTDAPGSIVRDILRAFIKDHPVKKENIKEGAPAHALLNKACQTEVSFKVHKDVEAKLLTKIKLVRYQENPPNSGPLAKASMKRRVTED